MKSLAPHTPTPLLPFLFIPLSPENIVLPAATLIDQSKCSINAAFSLIPVGVCFPFTPLRNLAFFFFLLFFSCSLFKLRLDPSSFYTFLQLHEMGEVGLESGIVSTLLFESSLLLVVTLQGTGIHFCLYFVPFDCVVSIKKKK